LGRTHAQVVCSAVGDTGGCPGYPAVLSGAGEYAYYEVGLNWELPTYRYFSAGLGAGSTANFANQKISSVQRAIERTYWATASLATGALSEFHPKIDYGQSVADENLLEGPLDGNLTAMGSTSGLPVGIWGMATPYGAIPFAGNPEGAVVQPAFSPADPVNDEDFRVRPYSLQTQVSALVTRWQATFDAAGLTLEFDLAPIVRVWCLLTASPTSPGNDSPSVAPRPIPRGGIGAYRYNGGASAISMIPGVNVQVIQKNTSAIDNTDLPVYDIGADWATLNSVGGPTQRTSRPTRAERLSFPKTLKDED